MRLDPQQWSEKVIEKSEAVIYAVVALLLLLIAAALLVQSVTTLAGVFEGKPSTVAVATLDLLLLVFIVVELLYAVRTMLAKRELLAEPFLLVGIIASIKEIVVLSVKAPDLLGTERFEDTLGLIGALIIGVFLLALAAWLLRRKEREPSEASDSEPQRDERKEAQASARGANA